MRRRARAGVAGAAALGCVLGGLLLPAADAAPANAATADLTITPNPWYSGGAFEGWGTSLVWFANATGGYPEELREQLYQAVFGEEGLDLNIARYNIGGGNASDVEDYLRAGGAVEGYWAADPDGSEGVYEGAATTYAERDAVLEAWDPDDPAGYDWSADETQRWWIERLVADDQISHWETFANSAPYFMTESGYVSGGFDASAEQLKPEADEKFVRYLTRVTEFIEDSYGISVDTIDPFNEPNTNYWGTTLRDGVPVGGRQEGMHVGPERQVDVVRALAAALQEEGTTTDAGIAAMDETNPGTFARNWAAYPAEVRDLVDRLNVHTYGTSGRLGVRDLAKQADSPLWMSEIEGSWVNGWDPLNIENGLGIAGRVMDDLRELEPDAWVLWQPVEDLYNMQPQGEDLNWGSVFIDLDCAPFEEGGEAVWKSERRVADAGANSSAVEACGVQTNSKFNTLRNFTKFIEEGDRLIAVDDVNSTAAVTADGSGATIVHRNTGTDAQTIELDLSGFANVEAGASVTGHVTTEAASESDPTGSALVPTEAVAVDAATKTATVRVPAKSVTTFEVTGVSGVSDEAPGLRDGTSYQLVGTQSGKALSASDEGSAATVIASAPTTAEEASAQKWTVHEVAGAERESTRRVVLENGDGRILAATSAGTELRSVPVDAAAQDASSTWFVNTTDGRAFSLVNEGLALSLDVNGQSSQDGAGVGVYGSNGGGNQSWRPLDLAPADEQVVALRTEAGVVPTLPATVVARYSWGAGGAAEVEWALPGEDVWQRTGQVRVEGSATDLFGQTFPVTAVVDVGGLTVTDPVSVTVAAGSSVDAVIAAAPTTVPARVGASENTFEVPVTWDFAELSADQLVVGAVLPVTGSADADGGALPATLSVLVTAGTPRNFATEDGVTASATSTEGGYSADATRNGITTDKGWSNWVSSNKPTQDTLTYEFDSARDVSGARITFYADGSATSWAQSLQFQYRDQDGEWVPAEGYEEAVAVAVPGDGTAPVVSAEWAPVSATGLRIVMNAYPNTHMTVSEVEIFEPSASPASVSALAALRLDGIAVEGFAGDRTAYTATVDGSRYPTVTAIPVDRAATVSVESASEENEGVVTATVVSADGSSTSVYTVGVERHVLVRTVTITGEVRAGAEVASVVDVDPGSSEVDYEWLLDGEPVDGGDRARFAIPEDAAGAALSLRVSASADGFADAAPVVSDEITVADAVVVPVPGDGDEGDGGPGSPAPAPQPASPDADRDGPLAATGASFGALPLFAFAVMIAGAAALALARRRRFGER